MNASITLTGGSRVQGNAAVKRGGGLAVWNNAKLTLTGANHVQGNTARGSGGGLVATEHTVVSCTGCIISHNTVTFDEACALLLDLQVRSGYTDLLPEEWLTLDQLKQEHPECECQSPGSNNGYCCAQYYNVRCGGVCAEGNASVTLARGSTIYKNIAVNGSGGGVLAGNLASVRLTGGSSV